MSIQVSSVKTIDTLVIGAGQAGLVTGYQLQQNGSENLVIEQSDRPAHRWLDNLWDSFTLVTPNWNFKIPGAEYDGNDKDGFMSRHEVAARFHAYVDRYQLPIQYNTQALAVRSNPAGAGFEVQTSKGILRANQVVVATGLFQRPRIPSYAKGLPSHIFQVHSSDYKNPGLLSQGAVLVVGSSQSGCQIADEIHRSGRKVYLCVGKSGRAPRRYRGKDSSEWLDLLGLSDQVVERLPSPRAKFSGNPHIVGRVDGRNLNLHQFERDGITLLGRLTNVQDGKLQLAPDLHKNLQVADEFEASFLKRIDHYIDVHALDCPLDTLPQLQDGYQCELTAELELLQHGIETVIWAAGYQFDFSMIEFPVFDEDGYPIQKRGITCQPGLYFVGLPWLHKQRSGLLSGVGDDAAHIATHILSKSPSTVSAA